MRQMGTLQSDRVQRVLRWGSDTRKKRRAGRWEVEAGRDTGRKEGGGCCGNDRCVDDQDSSDGGGRFVEAG